MGVLDQERFDKIKRVLRGHVHGATISDLASEIKMNRNLVAKYLDMLLISGAVDMQLVGAAKVYFLSRRVPISALLDFSSDLVIISDSKGKILQTNELVPALIGMRRDILIGKRLDEIDNSFFRGLDTKPEKPGAPVSGEKSGDIDSVIDGEVRHFRVKRIPTAFEDGSDGFTFIVEDVTARKMFEEKLRISEARYRGLVQSSGEAIIGTAIDGKITGWNPAAERLYGFTAEEILGKSILILAGEGGKDELSRVLSLVGEGESIRRYEMKMLRGGGEPVDVLITISPISGDNGTIAGASLIVRDITGEKMEQCLREHEERYRKLVEDLNVGIYRSTGDPRGKFIWGNTALLNILGYQSMSDLQGTNVIDIFSSPDARLELISELHKFGFVKNRILHLRRGDGRPISVCVTALADFDKNSKVVFINGIVQDITDFGKQV